MRRESEEDALLVWFSFFFILTRERECVDTEFVDI